MSTVLELARQQINAQPDIDRRAHHTQLASWYRGEGAYYLDQLILRSFSDPLNQAVRRRFVAIATTTSVIRRAANELALVYAELASRRITSGNIEYQALLEALGFDDVMREASRLLSVHHALWIEASRVDGEPRIDVHTPDNFAVVSPHDDPRRVLAVAVKIPHEIGTGPAVPAWRIVTRDEVLIVSSTFELLRRDDHPSPGHLPGVLALQSPASARGCVLDARPSSELLACEEAVGLQHVLLLKESVSYLRQTFLTGDLSTAVVGQTADTDSNVVLPENSSVQAVDRGVDLTTFMRVSDALQDDTFSAYGISPAQRRRDSATSGFDLQLRRLPLLERRRQQLATWRRIEHALAAHLGRVFGFDASGFSVDFGEIEAPLSVSEELTAFEHARRLGLRTTIDELIRRNPDLDRDAAHELLAENVREETARIALMQDLAAQNANTSTAVGDETNGNREGETIQ